MKKSGLLLRNIKPFMGSVQLFIEKNAKNGNQITWRRRLVLSLSRCSVGLLQHLVYLQTGLNRPF